MTEQERLELEAHAAELERVTLNLYRLAKAEKYSHERQRASSAASAYEIQAVWLRGFLRRHAEEPRKMGEPSQTSPTS